MFIVILLNVIGSCGRWRSWKKIEFTDFKKKGFREPKFNGRFMGRFCSLYLLHLLFLIKDGIDLFALTVTSVREFSEKKRNKEFQWTAS